MWKWQRGLNFSQTRYRIIDENSFIPYIRSNFHASIPRQILENFDNFNVSSTSKYVILVEINDKATNKKVIRIKNLHMDGKSYVISLKAEKTFKKPKIKVLDLKIEKVVLERDCSSTNFIKKFIPQHTNGYKGSTPIYVFDYKKNLVVGGYYKKDLIIKNKIEFNSLNSAALGLYFAEGGKIGATFSNSYPQAINTVLEFVENIFGMNRKKIKASICCGSFLKNKKCELEGFWNSETGVANFSRTLHINKTSTSPQGILELYFCSETLKSIILKLLSSSFECIDRRSFIKGILSGDGSPIQQTKYNIIHHVAIDNKTKSVDFLKKIFSNFRCGFIKTQSKFVLYTNWKENKILVFDDVYRFNLLNRIRFAKRFLSLPKTLSEKNKETSKFRKTIYPQLLKDYLNFQKKLISFDLSTKEKLKEIKNEYRLY